MIVPIKKDVKDIAVSARADESGNISSLRITKLTTEGYVTRQFSRGDDTGPSAQVKDKTYPSDHEGNLLANRVDDKLKEPAFISQAEFAKASLGYIDPNHFPAGKEYNVISAQLNGTASSLENIKKLLTPVTEISHGNRRDPQGPEAGLKK